MKMKAFKQLPMTNVHFNLIQAKHNDHEFPVVQAGNVIPAREKLRTLRRKK
jgi:hypothetical protein